MSKYKLDFMISKPDLVTDHIKIQSWIIEIKLDLDSVKMKSGGDRCDLDRSF